MCDDASISNVDYPSKDLMYLVVIDPGQSTGIAEFAGTQLVNTTTKSAPFLLRSHLRKLKREQRGLVIVCEEGPIDKRHLDGVCAEVEAVVKEESESIYWVRPSQWKPHPAAVVDPNDLPIIETRHERDAVCIGRWFIARGRYHRYERTTAVASTT